MCTLPGKQINGPAGWLGHRRPKRRLGKRLLSSLNPAAATTDSDKKLRLAERTTNKSKLQRSLSPCLLSSDNWETSWAEWMEDLGGISSLCFTTDNGVVDGMIFVPTQHMLPDPTNLLSLSALQRIELKEFP